MARVDNPYQHLAIRVLEHAVQDWTLPKRAPQSGEERQSKDEKRNTRESVRKWLMEEPHLVAFWCDAAGLPVTTFYAHMRERGYYGPVPDPEEVDHLWPTDSRQANERQLEPSAA